MSLDIVKHEEGKRPRGFSIPSLYMIVRIQHWEILIYCVVVCFFFSLVLAPDSGWFFGGYCSNIGPMCLLL